MNFEKIYSYLPDFIKYNNNFYNFSLTLSNILRKFNRKNNQIQSQKQLLNIIFTSCDIKVSGNIRNIQLLYVELLRFIDNVCSKYEIEYWIDYGTLLGAVRHGGFIPWDDDIDISIMREDYEKLIKVLPVEIKQYPKLFENCGLTLLIEGHKNYFSEFKSVYDVENENNIKFPFLQIAWMKPYIKIDIFAKDYIRDDKLIEYKKNYQIAKYKFNNELKNSKFTFFKDLDNQKLFIGQTNNKTNFCANSLDHILLEKPIIFKVDNIFPLNNIKFENYYFKCPNNVHEHLKAKFGENYMEIPDIIENHNLVKFIENQFDSKDEMEIAFLESIEFLKKINDNF